MLGAVSSDFAVLGIWCLRIYYLPADLRPLLVRLRALTVRFRAAGAEAASRPGEYIFRALAMVAASAASSRAYWLR